MLRFPRNKFSNLGTSHFREQENVLAESKLDGGMITSIDAADLANNQFTDVKNFSVRKDRTSRRFGTIIYPITKPDSNKILLITPFKQSNGTVLFVRATPSTVYLGTVSAFNAAVGVLTGGADDRFQTAVANYEFYFTNSGVDYIQKLNPGALTFARAGNAPRYKYLTSFNNRLVGANEVDAITPNPIKIGWSGNLNLSEWNAATDQSAGFTSLVDSPTDFSDDITGIFGFTETGFILRERSLWGMNKAPVATNPFIFFVIAPGIGCDSPNSAVSVKNGICWFDLRTKTVYLHKVGDQEPTPIGRPIDSAILATIEDNTKIFGNYNTIEDEYTLCVPHNTSNEVTFWTYNFRTKAWVNEAQDNISALASIDYNSGSLVIDDLVGFINDLLGVINDLSVNVAIPSRFYGKTTGEILIENTTADTDNGTAFTSQLTSKVYSVPKNNEYIQTLNIGYIPRLAGSFTVYFSKDGGSTWTVYKTTTFLTSDIGDRKLCTFKEHINAGEYAWKLEATSGLFDLIKYEIKTVTSDGETKSH